MCTLRRFLALGVVLALVLPPAGCNRKKKEEPPEPQGNPLKPDPAGAAPGNSAVRRGAQMQQNKALLESFGKYYELYRTENGRPPRTFEEFRAYIKADPNARNEALAMDAGWIVWRFDPPPNTNQILAYEKEEFELHHNRLVLLGGGAVRTMDSTEFQLALKQQ
jgi:hypothetical protein